MISFKVLILTVALCITTCCSAKKEVPSCKEHLFNIGYSDFGFFNYCYANQFLDAADFKNHVKNNMGSDELKNENLNKILRLFLTANKDLKVNDELMKPMEFCTTPPKKTYKKPWLNISCLFNAKTEDNATWDCPLNDNESEMQKQNRCYQEITSNDKTKKTVIKKFTRGRSMKTEIHYDENKFRNAVVTYCLNEQKNADKKNIMKDWKECKKIYYKYQLAVFDKMKKSKANGYLITSKWCADHEKIKNIS